MFMQRSGEETNGRILTSIDLNQIFKEYSRLDIGLRRDFNFSGYLEILGLKGNSP